MTLLSQIMIDGYRELNLIAGGKPLSTLQASEGLALLNTVLEVCLGSDAGEELNDWPLGNYGRQVQDLLYFDERQFANPPINRRLINTAEAAMTVYLPARPSDGTRVGIVDPYGRLSAIPITLDGNGRTIEDQPSILLDVDGMDRRWLYRADLGQWIRLTDLTETDEMPFPKEFDFYFAIQLALRLSPRTGRKLDDASATAFTAVRRRFVARYLQSADLDINTGIDRLSIQSYNRQRDVTNIEFSRGT